MAVGVSEKVGVVLYAHFDLADTQLPNTLAVFPEDSSLRHSQVEMSTRASMPR